MIRRKKLNKQLFRSIQLKKAKDKMTEWKPIVGKSLKVDDFGDYIINLSFTDWRPQFIVLHNTSRPRLSQWHSTAGEQRMLNLQSYYRDEKKWSAGPHLFVADDLVWVFTPLTTAGIHSRRGMRCHGNRDGGRLQSRKI